VSYQRLLLCFLRCITTQSPRLLTVSNHRYKHGISRTKSPYHSLSVASVNASQPLSPFQQPQISSMGLRHLYHLLTNSKRKQKQSPQSEDASASSHPRIFAMHSADMVASTSQAEAASPQAIDEGPPNQEPQPSEISSGKELETAIAISSEIRADQRRYG
jgi:hypothetical protein